MRAKKMIVAVVAAGLMMGPLAGCENLPGGEKEQGAVIGAVGGAVAGAAIGGEDNRLVGALIGGALGAGGGYLIGAKVDEKRKEDKEKVREDAQVAVERAQNDPATAEEARASDDADINNDGFVTLDEVVAMEEARLADRDMIERLRATNQEFALTERQEEYLRQRGVSDNVIDAMREMKFEEARIASDRDDSDVEMRTDPGRAR